ncbi:MAG: universal stress protein [Acidimicrobiia bacterium]
MHVLIATAGALPPAPVADFLERVWRPGFKASVVTAIQVPREFLDELAEEAAEWSPLYPDDADDRSDDAEAVARYVTERGHKLAEPVVAALTARNIPTQPIFVDGSDAADAIVATAETIGASLIVMGATKRLFDEASWDSISARVVERARIPTLVVPGARADGETDE